jgi:hypothetical protein
VNGDDKTVISMSLELQTMIVQDSKQYLFQKPKGRTEYDNYLDYLTMKHKISKKAVKGITLVTSRLYQN